MSIGFADEFEDVQEELDELGKAKPEKAEKVEKEETETEEAEEVTDDEITDAIESFKESAETGEKKEEEAEEEVKGEEKESLTGETTPAEKIKEELVQFLEGKTTFKVKGKDYHLEDYSPEEVSQLLSLAGRAHQVMEENAQIRKDNERDREQLNRGAALVNQLLIQQQAQPQGTPQVDTVPDELKPGELDTDEVKTLKTFATSLLGKVNVLNQGLQTQQFQTQEQQVQASGQQLLAEVNELKKEYKCADADGVVAIKSVYPNIPTKELVQKSHEHYIADDFLSAALEANPEFKRVIEENAVKTYQAAKVKAKEKRIPTKKSSSVVVKGSKKTAPITFDNVEARINEYLKEL